MLFSTSGPAPSVRGRDGGRERTERDERNPSGRISGSTHDLVNKRDI